MKDFHIAGLWQSLTDFWLPMVGIILAVIFLSILISCLRKGKWLGAVVTCLFAAVLAAAAYFRFFFVFGEGVKSGELNYVVYKGVLFKTYEGKLIQTGIRSKAAGSIQSYEFEFSVENEALARELMLQGGKTLELHYKEYFGALPWRGFTKFVVDSIITVRPAEQGKQDVDR